MTVIPSHGSSHYAAWTFLGYLTVGSWMNPINSQLRLFLIILVCVLPTVTGPAAFASSAAVAPAPVSASVVPCSLAQPGSITQVLVCTNKSEAMQRVEKLDCHSGDAPQVLEVRDVWRGRASLEEGAAAGTSLILAHMAHCLVSASLGLHPIEPAEPSATLYLRQALGDPSDLVVLTAITGLMPVLTPEDLATVIGIASSRPTLALPTVTLLSGLCDSGAKAGVKAIRAAYAGLAKGAEIDQYLAQAGESCDAFGRPIH